MCGALSAPASLLPPLRRIPPMRDVEATGGGSAGNGGPRPEDFTASYWALRPAPGLCAGQHSGCLRHALLCNIYSPGCYILNQWMNPGGRVHKDICGCLWVLLGSTVSGAAAVVGNFGYVHKICLRFAPAWRQTDSVQEMASGEAAAFGDGKSIQTVPLPARWYRSEGLLCPKGPPRMSLSWRPYPNACRKQKGVKAQIALRDNQLVKTGAARGTIQEGDGFAEASG
ncbi:hypothetical protein B0H17DRAFT_1148918 [Mycena rosella]|uniref:Uncharacterized protein n=1 Tax=Mycena rosella TaxID=1033263 RepID=A0AAD7C6S5_MYCRO|nr:hypothetical protein B0H17DRAFT_1148918 [Mycena rosella]